MHLGIVRLETSSEMSRLSDEDLRAAFRLRAVGRPSRLLHQRIRHATRPAQQPRLVHAIHGVAPRRAILARLTAVAAVAAVLILAPVVGSALDGQGLDLISDSRSPNRTAAGVNHGAMEDGDDDEGDDEDGIDEDDEGDDDAGDDEDGIDEDDEDDEGDDDAGDDDDDDTGDDDREDSEDDN